MLVNKTLDAQAIVNNLDSRLDSQVYPSIFYFLQIEEENSFKVLNELANIMRKHNNLELAINLYKKSL